MGVSAAVGIGALVAGTAVSAITAPKPPKPPAAPEAEAVAPEANAAADRQRRKNTAAYGRSDTILTGPSGTLGGAPMGSGTAPKSILGG
jgi:hypothetical protein